VYRDDEIAVAYKPARLSSMPAKEQRHFSLKKSLETLLGVTIHMPSRLDVSARGLVLVSTSPRAHAPLQRAFESRRVIKRYLCATKGECGWDRKVEQGLIGRDPRHPVLRISPATQGQSAETIFTNLGKGDSSGEEVTILCAQPVTGRTHQIRVHASANRLPLYGDMFYGGAPAQYLHLASVYLAFKHPLHERRIELSLPERFQTDWMRSSIGRVSSL
jgi:tRNA pseudouridine32 synthase/23S rRNA pseudouridine746 synthase